jgi:EAL domain-containing protein (putative c-di-GMP-specific phosphodiesterase class I)
LGIENRGRQCAVWRKAGLALTVSVNLPGQFYRDDLTQRILEIVRAAGCDRGSSSKSPNRACCTIWRRSRKLNIARRRFLMAIDDFGRGTRACRT